MTLSNLNKSLFTFLGTAILTNIAICALVDLYSCLTAVIKFHFFSLLRSEEVIRTGTSGKGSLPGAGSAVTVSPSGGHTSC